jgi:type III secretion system low calcium response chaperone LcrH/SycD
MAQTAIGPAALQLKEELEALSSSRRFTAEELETMYGLAYQAYTQGKHHDGLCIFQFVVIYAPTNFKYLRALGAASKQCEDYDKAFAVFSYLAMLEPHNPAHTLMVAEIQLLLGQTAEAEASLRAVAAYCHEVGGSDKEMKRAEAILHLLVGDASIESARI